MSKSIYPTIGDTFKKVFNVKPTPERQAELTQQRITELEREVIRLSVENVKLRKGVVLALEALQQTIKETNDHAN